MSQSPGARFRAALSEEQPLQIAGAINAYSALLAERAGFRAIYLSGSGVAAASYGLPDLGVTTREDVLIDVGRIVGASELPLLVDIDTGWGDSAEIARTIVAMSKAGAAAVHIEDQVELKRCGHRPNKRLVTCEQMCDRIKAAVDARPDSSFFVMARSDALAVEGMEPMLERIAAYREAGADGIFAEAMTERTLYRRVVEACGETPVLANLTEFGKTPLFTIEQLRDIGVAMALYPLSAFRAMSLAAVEVFEAIRRDGSQGPVLDRMQTRDQLYDVLGYHHFEADADRSLQHQEQHGEGNTTDIEDDSDG